MAFTSESAGVLESVLKGGVTLHLLFSCTTPSLCGSDAVSAVASAVIFRPSIGANSSFGTFFAAVSSTSVRRTLRASLPKLKNEKKYYTSQLSMPRNRDRISYLVNRICHIIINDPDFACLRKLHDLAILDIDDILNRQRDLNTVSLIVRAEDNLLERFDPFLSTWCTVGFELVLSLVSDNFEV